MNLFNTQINSPILIVLTIIYFLSEAICTFDTRIIQAKKGKFLAEDDAQVPSWTGFFVLISWIVFIAIFLLNWWYALVIFVIKFILKVLPVLQNIGAFLLIPIVGKETAFKVNIVAKAQKEAKAESDSMLNRYI